MREAAVGVEGDEASAQLLEGDVDLAENVDGHSILEGRAAECKNVRVVRVENGGKNDEKCNRAGNLESGTQQTATRSLT